MKPDFERAKQTIFEKMGRELSPQLTYHSLDHTRLDVLPAAIRLGRELAIGDEEMLLLTTAALYHDTGFLIAYEEHEAGSIAIARASLPGFNYSPAQIQAIAEIIAATKLPQSPTNFLGEILCDADLELLGREDFMRLNVELLEERRHYSDEPLTRETWLRDQIRFLEEHRFFTAVALRNLRSGKERNIDLMRAELDSLNGSNLKRDSPNNRPGSLA
jgi:uncharacterized protein